MDNPSNETIYALLKEHREESAKAHNFTNAELAKLNGQVVHHGKYIAIYGAYFGLISAALIWLLTKVEITIK